MPTLTITVAASPAARVAHAVGRRLSLGRDATLEEVTEAMRDVLRNWTKQSEDEEAAIAAAAAAGSVELT